MDQTGYAAGAALEGAFYRMECGNSFVSGLYRAREFAGHEEAIRTAADYEAALSLEIYRSGRLISRSILYQPGEDRTPGQEPDRSRR